MRNLTTISRLQRNAFALAKIPDRGPTALSEAVPPMDNSVKNVHI